MGHRAETTADFDVAYGQRIHAARVMAGLTQLELAGRLGLTRSSIANIEAGRQRVMAAQVPPAAEALGCDPRWLLTGWDPDRTVQDVGVPRRAVTSHVAALRRLAAELEHATSPDTAAAAPAPPYAPEPTLETR
jgi:transcriptional regulator with XRE-family HTH domain